MELIRDDRLKEIRMSGRCAWCLKKVQEVDPAHIFSRGAGRVDAACNLVPLCRWCHTRSENANHWNGERPNRDDLLAIVRVKQGVSANAVWELVQWFRRTRWKPGESQANGTGRSMMGRGLCRERTTEYRSAS